MSRLGHRWLVLVLAAAAAAFLLRLSLRPTWIPFPPGGEYSDALIAHLSSAAFTRRAIETWGQIPLWNPTILSGYPFAADPLSGLWYPPLWALAILPQPLTLNLVVWLHLVIAGVGMYTLLRNESLGKGAALVGGLAFAGMPKLVGHVGLGHASLVAAVAWTPWALHAAGRAADHADAPKWIRRFILLGLVLGVTFLADPRWFLPTLMAALAYGIWRWSAHKGRVGGRMLVGGASAAAAVLALTAVVALPFLEFAGQTTRAGLAAGAGDAFAMPAARLLGLLVTDRAGWAEWMSSMGATAFVLAVAGVAGWARRARFWLIVASVAILLSVGAATPFGSAAASLPGFSLLRVPARWLFLAGLCVAALAAHGVEVLDSGPARRRARLAALAAGGTIVGVNLGMIAIGGFRPEPAMTCLAAILATAFTRVVDRAGRLVWGGALFAILIIGELTWIDSAMIDPRSPEAASSAGETAAERIGDLPDGTRLFSPSYSVPQDVAARVGLDLADGVHPLQLADYVGFMTAATGMTVEGYSVTLPPFESGDPSVDWEPDLDAYRLGLLAVSKVVASYPLVSEGIDLESAEDGLWIYTNRAARPRAWVEPADALGILPAEAVKWTPNHVELRAHGPGRLVLSEIDYPGWTVTVDGEPASIEPYQGVLRSVEIPGGAHEVSFAFVPPTLLAGLALSLAALTVTAVLWRRA